MDGVLPGGVEALEAVLEVDLLAEVEALEGAVVVLVGKLLGKKEGIE